jgi:hypothetical protein
MKLRFLLIVTLSLSIQNTIYSQKQIPNFASISKVDTMYSDSTSISYSVSYVNSSLKIIQTKIPLDVKTFNANKVKNPKYSPITILLEGKLVNEDGKLFVVKNNRRMMTLQFDEAMKEVYVYDNILKELNKINSFKVNTFLKTQ